MLTKSKHISQQIQALLNQTQLELDIKEDSIYVADNYIKGMLTTNQAKTAPEIEQEIKLSLIYIDADDLLAQINSSTVKVEGEIRFERLVSVC